MIIFVTGTGTDVGKTVVSALLSSRLSAYTGKKVGYFKPVQTGPANQDADWVRLKSKAVVFDSEINYELAASPDQAFLVESKNIKEVSLDEISSSILEKSSSFDFLIVEGAGGLYVPLNTSAQTWMDLVSRPEFSEVALVVASRTSFGTLNHTSLTIEALKNRGFSNPFCVFSGLRHEANEQSLKRKYPDLKFALCDQLDFDKDDQFELASVEIAKEFLSKQENEQIALSSQSNQTIIDVARDDTRAFVFDPGANLDDLVRAINQVGAAPGDLMAILEALKQAGAIDGQLVVI